MTDEFNLKEALIQGYLSDILFSDFVINQEYEIMLLDFTNARKHKDNRSTFNYMVVDGYSLFDYEFPILKANRKVVFNFSMATFLFAWYRINNHSMDMNQTYNLRLKFKRESLKKFIILEYEIIQ